LQVFASVAAAVASYTSARSMHTVWESGRAYIHMGVMVAVAILMACSSVHVLKKV